MDVRKIKKYGLVAQAEWTGKTEKFAEMDMFVFEFKTESGEVVSISGLPPISVDRLRDGESVPVIYLETSPGKTARFVGKEYGFSYSMPVAIFIISLMLLYGIYGIRAGRRA